MQTQEFIQQLLHVCKQSSKMSNFCDMSRGYETCFVPNSAKHDICPANKSQLITISNSFLLLSMKLSLLMNMKCKYYAFRFLLGEKISCSAELSIKKVYNLGARTYGDMIHLIDCPNIFWQREQNLYISVGFPAH